MIRDTSNRNMKWKQFILRQKWRNGEKWIYQQNLFLVFFWFFCKCVNQQKITHSNLNYLLRMLAFLFVSVFYLSLDLNAVCYTLLQSSLLVKLYLNKIWNENSSFWGRSGGNEKSEDISKTFFWCLFGGFCKCVCTRCLQSNQQIFFWQTRFTFASLLRRSLRKFHDGLEVQSICCKPTLSLPKSTKCFWWIGGCFWFSSCFVLTNAFFSSLKKKVRRGLGSCTACALITSCIPLSGLQQPCYELGQTINLVKLYV